MRSWVGGCIVCVCVLHSMLLRGLLLLLLAHDYYYLLPATVGGLVGWLLVDTVLSLMVLAGGVRYIHQSSPI